MLAAFECQQQIIILGSRRNVKTLYCVKIDQQVIIFMVEVQRFSTANCAGRNGLIDKAMNRIRLSKAWQMLRTSARKLLVPFIPQAFFIFHTRS